MANDLCVFCGQKPGTFRSTTVRCGVTVQTACKSCEKELSGLEELELCRRALVRGLAEDPERIRERIDFLEEVETYRPRCLRCSVPLTFRKAQWLDNNPTRDSIFTEGFEILPAVCTSCGKMEFYDPAIARESKHLTYLIWKDTKK